MSTGLHNAGFLEHLDEMRRRLIVALVAMSACAFASFFYADKILDFMAIPMRPYIDAVYFFSPADAFVVKIKVSLLSGLIFSSPVILAQLWLFVSPALYPNERRAILPLTFITTSLFVGGSCFSFFKVAPMTLQFLMSMQTEFMKPMVSMSEYISFLTMMVIAFGFAFNLPVFILALVASRVVGTQALNKFQRHVIVLIFIAAAVLTPGPDIASQLMLAIPLLILFELSIVAAYILEFFRSRKKITAHD